MDNSVLRWIIVGLTLITAAIHLFLGVGSLPNNAPFGITFLLNGLGYLALLAALLFDVPFFTGRDALLHTVFIFYTALTFVLYFVFNGLAFDGPLAIVSKLAEFLLIIVLFMHMQQARVRAA